MTTGLVFTGVVGTSGNRREYSVLGDIVNLSARLMQAACSENEYKILVDEETKRDAENKIKFIFFEFRTVKGKSGQIPIYAPVNCLEENRKDMGEQLVLRTHLYNVPDDMLMIEQYKDSLYMLRREKELIFVKKMLDEFIKNEKSKLVLIRGEYGIGKTLFIRCVLEGLKMKLNSEQKLWNHETIFIFINRFTSLSQKKKLNGFRLFLQFSIEKLRIRFKVDHYTEIFKILQLKPENVKTIVNVLDLDPIAAAKKEIIIDKEKILKEETIILKEFMINIIKLLIEKNNSPLVLCFDDMQGFDEESWNFLIQILESFPKKIFLFCAIRDAHLESSVNLSIFHRYFKKLQKLMKFMKQDETIMFDSSLVQIHLKQINLVDSLELSRKICGSDIIPENLVHFLHHKTKGNPLKLIQLLQNLLESQLISKNINSIVISEEMSNLLYINEFLTLPLPLSSIKINNTILDRLNCKQILLMKAASIIGDTFSLIVLKKLNPFKDQAITNDEVENILKELEKIELIGIIDETESNITFQFNGVFMREVLYQRMTYNQRRELHKIFAETIQNFSTSLFLNTKAKAYEKVQCEKLMFHWKLAETKSADTTKNAFPLLEKEKISAPSNLSNLAKRSVIVKKISSLASTKFLNPLSTLKKDFLQYKFVNDFFYSKKFCVLSFKDLKIYPSEDEFLDKPEKSIGLISLKQIFSIVFISEKNRNVFSLQTGSFQTRENKDLGLVQLLFSHQDFDILEEWATYIEFARAKAIYDDFVNTFGKISFPLQSEQRIIKKERALRKKVKNKIDNPQSSLSIKINENKGLIDSLKDYGAQNVSYLQTKHQKLKESLNTLMNHGLLLFFSSLIENQGSEETKGKHFSYGKNTDFLKKFPELLTIKPSLLEEEDEESPQNYPIDNKLNDIPIRNNNSLIKKTVSIVELKSLKVFVKKTNKTSESILITNCEENLSDEDAKINEPSESINLLNRFTNMKSSGGVGSLNNEKNNTNKFFTFNSTHSLSLDLTANERRQSGGLEILKLGGSSILLPPTPKINFHNELSQIQEEDLENDQKLVNNQERQYKLKGTTQKRISDDKNQLLPLVFYSRKNSLKKKEFFKKEQKIKKNKKTKKLGSKVWVIMEFESEEKISLKRKSETNEGQNDIVSSSSLSIKNHFIGETKQNLVSSSLINNFLNETSKKSIKNAMDGSKTKIIGKINEISSLSLSRNFLDESKKLHSNQPSNMVKSMPKDMAISAVKLKKSSKDSLYIVKSSNIKDISFYSDLKESSFDEKKKNMQILEKNSSNEKKKIKGFSEKKMEESFEIVKIKNNDSKIFKIKMARFNKDFFKRI